jgi:hypothetical protein
MERFLATVKSELPYIFAILAVVLSSSHDRGDNQQRGSAFQ